MYTPKVIPLFISVLLVFNLACTQGGSGSNGSSDPDNSTPVINPPSDDPVVPDGSFSSSLTTNNFQNNLSTQTISANGKRTYFWTVSNTSQSEIKDLSANFPRNIEMDAKSTCGQTSFSLNAGSSCLFILKYTAPNVVNDQPINDTFSLIYANKSNSIKTSKTLNFIVWKSLYSIPSDLADYQGLPSPLIKAVVPDNNGAIYIGTSNGMTIMTPDKDGYKYQIVPSLRGKSVSSIFIDPSGLIYVGTTSGLFVGADKDSIVLVNETSDFSINCVYVDNNKTIFLGVLQQASKWVLFTRKASESSFTPYNAGPVAEMVVNVVGNSEYTYLATKTNLYRTGTDKLLFTPLTGLPEKNAILGLRLDNNKVFVNTYENGVYFGSANDISVKLQKLVLSPSYSLVTSFFVKDEILYFGYMDLSTTPHSNYLSYGTIEDNVFKQTANILTTQMLVTSLFVDSANHVFAGTLLNGVWIGTKKEASSEYTFASVPCFPVAADDIKDVFIDKKGKIYILLTYSGLSIGTSGPNGYTFLSASAELIKQYEGLQVTKIVADVNETVYIGATKRGVGGHCCRKLNLIRHFN